MRWFFCHHSSKTGALLDPGLQGLTGPAKSSMDLSQLTMANDQRGEGTHRALATNSLPARMKGQIRVLVTCPSSLVNIYNSIKVQDFSTWENVNGVSAFSMMGRPPGHNHPLLLSIPWSSFPHMPGEGEEQKHVVCSASLEPHCSLLPLPPAWPALFCQPCRHLGQWKG